MRNSLGISTGSAGVCSALVTTDDAGSQTVEYRTISADLDSHADVGDLALSAIGLMTTQVPDCRIEPDAIAVAYRTDRQAAAVRSAARTQRKAIRLVPEAHATLAYLRSTGLVDRYDCIALADLGASGLTVTVVDPADGTVTFCDRTSRVRAETAPSGFAAGIGSRVAKFVADSISHSERQPAAVVLVGGGGNIPDVGKGLDTAFDCAVIVVPEPEAATAKGAALLAGSNARQQFPVVTGSRGRLSAPLIAAFVLGALIIGYGVQQMIPKSAENYSPAGSLVETPSEAPTSTDHPTSTVVQPEETGIPSVDPTPTSTVPVPAAEMPSSTSETTAPTVTTTTPVPPTPTSTTPEPPKTTKQTRPWIPPQWPEEPSWLPDNATPPRLPSFEVPGFSPPDFDDDHDHDDRPQGQPGMAPGFAPPRPPDSVPGFGGRQLPERRSAISPEPGSPTPEVPDSSPR
ncbi:exopolyphosphatase [Prescottella agglutinans]|uniref:exopolyphosphatase n=1 Tax=Prescottella agglutinans TaxID=1644129 RepID=UPI003D96686A